LRNFLPLPRLFIGFGRFLDTENSASRVEQIDNWPPDDIIRAGSDAYRITMAAFCRMT